MSKSARVLHSMIKSSKLSLDDLEKLQTVINQKINNLKPEPVEEWIETERGTHLFADGFQLT